MLPKIDTIDGSLINKMFQLFVTVNSLKIRQQLSEGLYKQLAEIKKKQNNKASEFISKEVLYFIKDLNTLKRGYADMELDYDLIIKNIEEFLKWNIDLLNTVEVCAIVYNLLFIIQHTELSIRDFAKEAFSKVLDSIQNKILQQNKYEEYQKLIFVIEQQMQIYIQIKDEFVLKTILEVLRIFILFIKEVQKNNNQMKSILNLYNLHSIVNLKDENDDFFITFLSIKLKSRQRALKVISQKIQNNQLTDMKAIQQIIIPLINYQLFGGKSRKQSQRGMITYDKDQKRQTIDYALNVYEIISSKLSWPQYFKILKTFMYKLQKIENQRYQTENQSKDPEQQYEKIVMKVVTHMLAGFHFSDVPDAIHSILQKQNEINSENNEFEIGDIINQIIKKYEIKEDILENNEQQLSELNESVLEDVEEIKEDHIMEVLDIELKQDNNNQIAIDIQKKLSQKLLPLLEKQLFSSEQAAQTGQLYQKTQSQKPLIQENTIKQFVALAIVKLIRKLPIHNFQSQLSKLIKIIVTQGLRSRDLGNREKARKALVKIVKEISPKFLPLIIEEMQQNLVRGFQKKVYIYSLFYILNQLAEEKLMQTGIISNAIIESTVAELLTDMLECSNQADRDIEDAPKQQSKEAKAKKVPAIFEIYAQFLDFKKSLLTFLMPIITQLESNPNVQKIQLIEELLNKVSNNLLKNESIQQDQLLVFIYSTMQKGLEMAIKVKINDEKAHRDYGQKLLSQQYMMKSKHQQKLQNFSIDMLWEKSNQNLMNKKTREISGRVLAFFGMQCLKRIFKTKMLQITEANQSKNDITEQLDPFVPLLLQAFKIYYNPIVVVTLNIISSILPYNLPSFNHLSKKFMNRILKLFKNTNNSDVDFLNSLFKTMSELIKQYAVFKDLSEEQLKALVAIIKQNLDSYSLQSNVFQCLNAIIYKKFVCADLYDLIENVQEMMITNVQRSVRNVCQQIFVKFLIEYPLEEARVDQHVNYLIKNLGYFEADGRIQVLEIIHSIIERFPQELNDKYAEILFFSFMLRFANEQDQLVKDKISQVLKHQILKISNSKTHTFLNTVLEMESKTLNQLKDIQDVNQIENIEKKFSILQAKYQVLTIICSNNKINIKQGQIKQMIEEFLIIVQNERNFQLEQIQKEGNEEENDGFQNEIINENMKSFYQEIELFQNQNIENQELSKKQQKEDRRQKLNFMKWKIQYYVLICFEALLPNNKVIIDELKKNNLIQLTLEIGIYHQNYQIKLQCQKITKYLFENYENNEKSLLKQVFIKNNNDLQNLAFQQLNLFKYQLFKEELADLTINNIQQLIKILIQINAKEFDLNKLIKKASYIGRKIMFNIQQAKDKLFYLFQLYLNTLTYLKTDVLNNNNNYIENICGPILELVYRVYTDEQYLDSQAKVKAYEIVDFFQNHLEKASFVKIYNEVKTSILQKRVERKQKEKVAIIGDVEAVKRKEKKRQKKNERKQIKKMQKLQEMIKRK